MDLDLFKNGDVVAYAHGMATTVAGGVLVGADVGFVFWYVPTHRRYLGGRPCSADDVCEHFRPATPEERDTILMKFVNVPLFEDSPESDQVAYATHIKPQVDELQQRVPLIKCPYCEEMLPKAASDAQVKHTEENHPEELAAKLRSIGEHRKADEVEAGGGKFFPAPPE
jgi:hypothetical protein